MTGDLLSNSNHFFPAEFLDRLEQSDIARLFKKKGAADTVRAWSIGCATGEEAYSLAMLLIAEAARHKNPPKIKIFASDLHGCPMEKAREGFYAAEVSAEIGTERLGRFFQNENGGHRIREEVRDVVVFASHNLLTDPPFSRLDLISCPDLLVQLERGVQQDMIELFHFTLNADGALLLGSASTGSAATVDVLALFEVEDERLGVFRKRRVLGRKPRLPNFPVPRTGAEEKGGAQTGIERPIANHDLHHRLIEKYAPPSILIGADDEIVHLSEHAGRYLELRAGEPTHNAIQLVRSELRAELHASLQHVRKDGEIFDSQPILVRFHEGVAPVVLHVRPSLDPTEHEFALVIFEERAPGKAEFESSHFRSSPADTTETETLRQDLSIVQQRLQATIAEYESSREEMNAYNEEMQSTNEELRSVMEELETSKEELQTINEQLQTVNQQNKQKVEELGQLSSDLQNLLIATDIATLFLDRNLRILRFTPKLGTLFNVRIADQGRPISDLTHRLGNADLPSDAQSVLDRLIPVERELQDDAGKWYLTRINPYRSADDRIDGVVVTLIDITDRKDAERMRLELLAKEKAAGEETLRREKEIELARVARTLMVGELTASVAHEVNQPLVGVVTNAEAGLRWLGGPAPNLTEVKNSLSLIVRDGNRASAVIRRVREFVKKDSGGVTELHIGSLIRDTLGLMGSDLLKHHVAVRLDIAELPAIQADRGQLEQVILNLILNAIEAMAATHGRPAELRISAEVAEEGGVAVSFSDSGVGIAAQEADRIFDAFFTTKPAGVGMGLSITRSIIQAHGGRIWASPNEDSGLTVHFVLPAARPDG